MFPPGCPQELVVLLEDCLQANPRARPDFLEVCSRLEALRHSLLRRLPNSDQDSLFDMKMDCAHYHFIEMRLKEHFQRQNAGVVADDEEMGVLIPQAGHVEQQVYQEISRTDQLPDHTTVEDRDLEIWTKQPGNEVFRKAVEEWREKCKMLDERIRMMKDLEVYLNKERTSRVFNHFTFIYSMTLTIICGLSHERMYMSLAVLIGRVQCFSMVLLEALIHGCWVIDQYQCFWRLWKAFHCDFNKRMVYNSRYDTLKQKREFFSFEDDVKKYDPSSNPPPKLTWLLLDCVKEVSRVLLMSIALIIFLSAIFIMNWDAIPSSLPIELSRMKVLPPTVPIPNL